MHIYIYGILHTNKRSKDMFWIQRGKKGQIYYVHSLLQIIVWKLELLSKP